MQDDELGSVIQIPKGSVLVHVDDTHQQIMSPSGSILTAEFAGRLIDMAAVQPGNLAPDSTHSPMVTSMTTHSPMVTSMTIHSPMITSATHSPMVASMAPSPMAPSELEKMLNCKVRVTCELSEARERAASTGAASNTSHPESDYHESDASASYVPSR